MAEERIYTCVCGKTYTNIQAFRGHKSNCKEHLTQTGRLHIREEAYKKRMDAGHKAWSEQCKEKREQALKQWIAEEHKCERCGKVMSEKFGSGRFCSEKCARSRPQTEETKERIRESVLKYNNEHRSPQTIEEIKNAKTTQKVSYKVENAIRKYYANPKKCCICGKIIEYKHRNRKTCCINCQKQLVGRISSESAKRNGGNNNIYGPKKSKYGTYKGIHCDSGWELAFVIYCLEHNIKVKRNTKSFPYTYKNKRHDYYPDFIVNNKYIEVKNYISERTQAKIDHFPKSETLVVLLGDKISICLNYCTEKYGKDYIKMYDKDKPSWMDKNKNDMGENNF